MPDAAPGVGPDVVRTPSPNTLNEARVGDVGFGPGDAVEVHHRTSHARSPRHPDVVRTVGPDGLGKLGGAVRMEYTIGRISQSYSIPVQDDRCLADGRVD